MTIEEAFAQIREKLNNDPSGCYIDCDLYLEGIAPKNGGMWRVRADGNSGGGGDFMDDIKYYPDATGADEALRLALASE